jgi:hypothetical protein
VGGTITPCSVPAPSSAPAPLSVSWAASFRVEPVPLVALLESALLESLLLDSLLLERLRREPSLLWPLPSLELAAAELPSSSLPAPSVPSSLPHAAAHAASRMIAHDPPDCIERVTLDPTGSFSTSMSNSTPRGEAS